MAGFSNAAMVVAADAVKAVALYGQLHSAAAGGSGTSNVTTADRESITWGSTTGNGDFGLDAQVDFTGGDPGGDVYSITLWSADTSGTYYGEFLLAGDDTFNAAGEYSVTAIDLDGTAS